MIRFGECSGKSWTVPSSVSLQYDGNVLCGYSSAGCASRRDTHCPHARMRLCVSEVLLSPLYIVISFFAQCPKTLKWKSWGSW